MALEFLKYARASLSRGRALPVGDLAEKVLTNGTAFVSAPVFLRHCNHVGMRARTRGRPVIENHGTITIGDDFQVNCAFVSARLHAAPGATLRIGNGVNINFGADVSAEKSVTLGAHVSLGPYVVIADHDRDEPGEEPSDVSIGNDVWLAARVRVKKGVTIGDGTIVTAGSVVETSLPPNVIAGGVPARVLRVRRSPAPSPALTPALAPALGEPSAPKPTRAIEARGSIVADFTANDLARAIERDEDALGPSISVDVAPFDQVVQTLHGLSKKNGHSQDFVFVWTRPERVSPAFKGLLQGEPVSLETILGDVDAFAQLALGVRSARHVFVATWTLPSHMRGLGMLDMRPGGIARALTAMNLRLAERLEDSPTTFALDASRWMASDEAYSSRLWYMGKVGFSRDVLAAAARDLRAALRGVRGDARKLLVLDLDDTMWGGIVGDVGWQNIRLGGHDAVGEALVDFQRAVLALSKRGIALAVVSKNEESVALDAIRSHPEMVLKQEHLAGWRINWRDKAQNIVDLVKELNLGLQSVVFIDDNPIERARVREALPEVLVPEWPKDKTRYVEAFHSLRCFDTPRVSQEDAERTKLYAQERDRSQLRTQFASLDDWLAGLGTVVRFSILDPSNLARTTQLLNKTNQMNLKTRRLNELELMEWSRVPGHEVWAVHVSDKLGDAGLTGILGLEVNGSDIWVADYVLSCRVMGRRVEETLFWFAIERTRARGAKRLLAPYVATPKNKPCLSFLESLEGLSRDGDVFVWDGAKMFDRPRNIEILAEEAP